MFESAASSVGTATSSEETTLTESQGFDLVDGYSSASGVPPYRRPKFVASTFSRSWAPMLMYAAMDPAPAAAAAGRAYASNGHRGIGRASALCGFDPIFTVAMPPVLPSASFGLVRGLVAG